VATIKKIKRRIKSIQSTQKITRAMKMVAATKLRRAQERAESARQYFNRSRDILLGVANSLEAGEHPLFAQRDVKRTCVIAITADRGLCGGYNGRLVKIITDQYKEKSRLDFLAIGRRGEDILRRQGYNILERFIDIPDYPTFKLAKTITTIVMDGYLRGDYEQILLAYTEFHSALTQVPVFLQLLPFEEKEGQGNQKQYIMEPSPAEIIDLIVPRYLENLIYGALLEAKASEFGARMTAMDAATESAQEMIDNLTVLYNRARQEEITLEMLEIVGGAEAIR